MKSFIEFNAAFFWSFFWAAFLAIWVPYYIAWVLPVLIWGSAWACIKFVYERP